MLHCVEIVKTKIFNQLTHNIDTFEPGSSLEDTR